MNIKNILVTGGFGILGRSVIKQLLLDKKNKVFLLDRSSNKKKISTLKLKSKNLKVIRGDFKKYKALFKLMKNKKIGTVFHLGAVTQVIDAYKSPIETFECNIDGTINILEAIRNLNKNIVFIYSSSDKAYGELKEKEYFEDHQLKGDFPYDVSKSASDLVCQSYVKTYGLRVGIIRSGNIYGPGDYNMNRLVPHVIISSLKNKKSVLRSNGKLIRDYIYVDDVSRAYVLLMKEMLKKKKKLYIYNLGSKENLTVLQLVKLIVKKIKNNALKPKILDNTTRIEIKRQKLNYSKINRELGWKPLWTLGKALEVTIDWYKNNLKLFK
jgi:CDP-glucose 4,6-dehydratase|tara:strand:- start:1071 stop:2045 length:975 start_codon:yes stop_codon:yes gene_type:complete